MRREYRAQARYGYIGIEEYEGDNCRRTVLTGIKPQRLGREVAAALQEAYQAGRDDMAHHLTGVLHWVQCPGCPGVNFVPPDGATPGHCPRHWHQGNPQP